MDALHKMRRTVGFVVLAFAAGVAAGFVAADQLDDGATDPGIIFEQSDTPFTGPDAFNGYEPADCDEFLNPPVRDLCHDKVG
jgi:hypothetical protein